MNCIGEEIYHAVDQLINDEEIILIHSSLSKLGYKKSKEYQEGIMSFLEKLLNENKTILLPSFTFSFTQKRSYNIREDKSETGILSELAIEFLGFKRTFNPMFSFAVKGRKESLFLNSNSQSGYGKGTAVSKITNEKVAIVMLGADWNSCTTIHAIEEEMQVPYREYVSWEYPVDFGSGFSNRRFELFARSKDINTIRRFDRIKNELMKNKLLRKSHLNQLELEAANALDVANIAIKKIEEDSYFFVERG
ncbi:AAC(3) family N-acetyltransferase [Priestia megaterium]|uniref:AAC(3) family N-acetyltransferase n=1 Tax=Priestia megaterium TaxID=1404 RepID=UPI003390A20B